MQSLVEPVLRFTQYALLLGLFGWSAFWILGLQSLHWLKFERQPVFFAILTALAAQVASSALMLISIAAMMGVSVVALDGPMIEMMIFGTDMGYAFIARTGLLVVALAFLLTIKRRVALVFAAGCFGSALVTLAWSGHAAASEGGVGLVHRLNNGIHLIGAGLWFGAIGWFLFLTFQCRQDPDGIRAQAVLREMHAFAPLGVALVAVVAFTGTINSHLIFGVQNLAMTLYSSYGILLAMKLALVAAMVGFGAHHARVSRSASRRIEGVASGSARTFSALRRTLLAEFLLGIFVTGLVAVLGTMSPTLM